LFADVELAAGAEATRLEIMGLDVEDDGDDGVVLQQPCVALKDRRCDIYSHRPQCCRTFECRLLQDVRRGVLGVERAAAHIARTIEQIRHVEELLGPPAREERLPLKERCAEALAGETSLDPRVNRKRDALSAAMVAVERSIRKTFLGESRRDEHG
jgi:Fe-S-cluster containining protein